MRPHTKFSITKTQNYHADGKLKNQHGRVMFKIRCKMLGYSRIL